MLERLVEQAVGAQAAWEVAGVRWWRRALRAAAVLNALVWFAVVAAGAARGDGYTAAQLALAGVFLGGCAFRSFFPTVYGRRLVLERGWTSSILVARCVATVAELAFALQLALLLDRWAGQTGLPAVGTAGRAVAALLAAAQLFCWYGVATRRYLGELLEESLWTLGGALVFVAAGAVALRRGRALDVGALVALAASGAFLAFMLGHNLPMYVARIRAHDVAGRHLGLAEGLRDMARRQQVSHRWPDWAGEAAWLTPYFTLGVWVSLAMPFAGG